MAWMKDITKGGGANGNSRCLTNVSGDRHAIRLRHPMNSATRTHSLKTKINSKSPPTAPAESRAGWDPLWDPAMPVQPPRPNQYL